MKVMWNTGAMKMEESRPCPLFKYLKALLMVSTPAHAAAASFGCFSIFKCASARGMLRMTMLLFVLGREGGGREISTFLPSPLPLVHLLVSPLQRRRVPVVC